MNRAAIESAKKVLNSGYIGQGPIVEKFEKELQKYFGTPHVATMNSATSALHLAFHMLRKDYEGCEVLCSPLTCTASNWPVLLNGYKIKWVDVDPKNCNMDLDDLMRKLSPTTRIVHIIHWGGMPINYGKLRGVLRKCYDLYGYIPEIVEDCAHCMGSHVGKVKVGNYLHSYAAYSFQAIKHVTSVDGGVLLCPNEESYKRAKLLRWYGIDRESNRKDFRCEEDIEEIGFKFHMNDVSAAIGLENLKSFDNAQRNREIAKRYNIAFKNNHGIRTIPWSSGSSYWLYTMFVERQGQFVAKMKEKGIMVSRVHERNDKHSCVNEYRSLLPNLDNIVFEMICIPCGWWVTDEDVEYIVNTINEGW
jgi:dTDP-4-amino-4,6-dideoxygalactose transaminase